MVNKDARYQVIKILNNLLLKPKNREGISALLMRDLVETGKMLNSTIQGVLICDSNVIDDLTDLQLCLIYKSIKQYNSDIPKIEELFTEIEIHDCELLSEKMAYERYPFEFNNCYKTISSGKQWKFILSIQELYDVLTSGNVKVVSGLQRDDEVTSYKGKLIQHVSYNNNVAVAISKCILEDKFYPTDEIKLHLITDGNEEYEIENDKIIIRKGTIALLDGQHRARGIQYALIENKDIEMNFSINFSIGTVEYGQSIIAQHELRQPMTEKVRKSYEISKAKDVFTMMCNNSNIEKNYKFVTSENSKYHLGFILKSDFIDSIERYYSVTNKTTEKEKKNLSKWLADFMYNLFIEYEEEFNNYYNSSKWVSNNYAIDGFIWLSSILYNKENWQELLEQIISTLDVSIEIKGRNKAKQCKDLIEKEASKYVTDKQSTDNQ